MQKYGCFKECSGNTEIFIYPGYDFKAINCLITNFHLPKSTLVMLVSALATKENILNAYKEAIANNGTFTMTGGTIRTSSNNASAVNNNAGGTMSMSSGSIIATGARQAIYDDGGTVTISGDASLTSAAKFESGKPRATVQANNASSVITILGGTIVSTHASGIAVTNLGTVTIGAVGGGIDITTPVLRANGKSRYSSGTWNIYDGILQCKTTTIIDGTITNSEPNTQPNTSGSVQINGTTFNTWYLESTI